jgi:hypothetical protein
MITRCCAFNKYRACLRRALSSKRRGRRVAGELHRKLNSDDHVAGG